MSENPNIIGQGAYGCIYKPAIKCKEESPTNYITKVQRLYNILKLNNTSITILSLTFNLQALMIHLSSCLRIGNKK